MQHVSEISYSTLIQFFANTPAIQEASAAERYSWLRINGLDYCITAASLAAEDSPLAFASKLVGFLSNYPADLAILLNYLADHVLNGREADTARTFAGWTSQQQLPAATDEKASLRDLFQQQHLEVNEENLFAMKAEAQEQLLQSAFVSDVLLADAHTFPDLLGPHSLCLFAQSGYGKSTLRLELARRARERTPPVLVCQLSIGALLASGSTDQGCLDLIVRSILEELRNRLSRPTSNWQRLAASEAVSQFLGLERAFGADRPVPLDRPSEGDIDAQTRFYQQRKQTIDFEFWLPELWGLVAGTGFGGIYLLVDRMDDYLPQDYDPPRALEILQHLLVLVRIMPPESRVAWKFFLNSRLEESVRQQLEVYKVMAFYRLGNWSERDLLRLFNFRLTHFASRGNVRTEKQLIDFCEPEVTPDLLLELAGCARGSPRAFIQLVKAIYTEHCRSGPPLNARIARITIEEVIRRHKPC